MAQSLELRLCAIWRDCDPKLARPAFTKDRVQKFAPISNTIMLSRTCTLWNLQGILRHHQDLLSV